MLHHIFTEMKYGFIVILFFSLIRLSHAQGENPITPIGFWRDHINYQNTIQVVKGGENIYAATKDALFYVEPDGEMHRLSKANGLNDIGISAIAWDETSKQLIIAYTNSNLDIIRESNIKNISDILRSTTSGDKTIYHIYTNNNFAYLSTGLGIIVIDLIKYEVKDTWRIGNSGNNVKVNAFTSDAGFYYAATQEGLKRASATSTNLANFSSWQNMSGVNGLSSGSVASVVNLANKIITQKNDSLFVLTGNTWNLFYTEINWQITSITSSSDKLLATQLNASGNSRIIQLNINGTVDKTIAVPAVISSPLSAIADGNAVWVADFFGGLSKHASSVERYIPNGPPGTASGEMIYHNNTIYVAAGEVNDAWNYQYNRNGIYFFGNDTWSYKGYFNTPQFDSVLDFTTLAIDPKDESLWGGSYGGGLANIAGNTIKIYKQQNSTLQPAIGDPGSYRVSGLAFDQLGNLWIANYGASQNLHVRKSDGTFKSFSIPFFHFENAVSQVLIDDHNQVWMVSPRGNGVFVLNHNNTIDNMADDKWKYLRTGIGNGNLPGNNVFTLAKDKNGFIWVGSDKGIGIVQCPENIFTSGCDAILPIVQQDQFTGYLFQNEEVRAIAVDAANRKWIGTRNGTWLISAEGEKTIYRFTENNSPLLSNDIKRIVINNATGEVFFSTFKGITSFRSTATAPSGELNEKVLVFPNPVPPNYNGTIAIKGLPENSLVKIAELNGRLIYQTRSLGGQAVWNGRNYKGESIASGVYLVIARTDEGNEKIVTKIVMVGGR